MPTWLIPLLLGGLQFATNFFEKKPGAQQFDTLTPEQKAMQDKALQMFSGQFGEGIRGQPSFQAGESYLTNLLSGNPEAFQSFEEPFKKQFFEETVPGLAERFSSLGAQRSSGFQNSLGRAGSDLSTNLAGLRSSLQMNALPSALGYASAPTEQAMNLLRIGLQPQFNSYYTGQQGPLSEFLSPITSAFGSEYGKGLAGKMWGEK